MTAIYVLYENTHDRHQEAVCWHNDGAVLEVEAERREWEHFRERKALAEAADMPGYRVLSPFECEYRRFTVEEIPRFGHDHAHSGQCTR